MFCCLFVVSGYCVRTDSAPPPVHEVSDPLRLLLACPGIVTLRNHSFRSETFALSRVLGCWIFSSLGVCLTGLTECLMYVSFLMTVTVISTNKEKVSATKPPNSPWHWDQSTQVSVSFGRGYYYKLVLLLAWRRKRRRKTPGIHSKRTNITPVVSNKWKKEIRKWVGR